MVSDEELIETLVELDYNAETMDWAASGPDGPNDVLLVKMQTPVGEPCLEEWLQLRRLVDRLGRWPLVISDPYHGRLAANLRFEFGRDDLGAVGILAAAKQADPEPIFDRYVPLEWLEDVTARTVFFELVEEEDEEELWRELIGEFGAEPSARDAERWLMMKRQDSADWVDPDGDWMDTGGYDPQYVALIPSTDPIAGLAYASAFSSRPVRSIPVVRRWVEQHGVELVGAVSCSYWFRMSAPLESTDDAYRLAVELLGLWDCSSGGGPSGIGPVELAPMLMRRRTFDGTTFP